MKKKPIKNNKKYMKISSLTLDFLCWKQFLPPLLKKMKKEKQRQKTSKNKRITPYTTKINEEVMNEQESPFEMLTQVKDVIFLIFSFITRFQSEDPVMFLLYNYYYYDDLVKRESKLEVIQVIDIERKLRDKLCKDNKDTITKFIALRSINKVLHTLINEYIVVMYRKIVPSLVGINIIKRDKELEYKKMCFYRNSLTMLGSYNEDFIIEKMPELHAIINDKTVIELEYSYTKVPDTFIPDMYNAHIFTNMLFFVFCLEFTNPKNLMKVFGKFRSEILDCKISFDNGNTNVFYYHNNYYDYLKFFNEQNYKNFLFELDINNLVEGYDKLDFEQLSKKIFINNSKLFNSIIMEIIYDNSPIIEKHFGNLTKMCFSKKIYKKLLDYGYNDKISGCINTTPDVISSLGITLTPPQLFEYLRFNENVQQDLAELVINTLKEHNIVGLVEDPMDYYNVEDAVEDPSEDDAMGDYTNK